MSFTTSFQKILEEKMQEPDSFSGSSSSQFQDSQTDPAYLAYLMGNIGRYSFNNKTAQKRYPHVRTSGTQNPQPAVPPVARPAHALNVSQAQSYEYLKSFNQSLTDSFDFQELKSAFRQAALRAHPDQGGSVALFIELKTHYQNLLAVLNPQQV